MKCNPKLPKASDTKYFCNTKTGRWKLRSTKKKTVKQVKRCNKNSTKYKFNPRAYQCNTKTGRWKLRSKKKPVKKNPILRESDIKSKSKNTEVRIPELDTFIKRKSLSPPRLKDYYKYRDVNSLTYLTLRDLLKKNFKGICIPPIERVYVYTDVYLTFRKDLAKKYNISKSNVGIETYANFFVKTFPGNKRSVVYATSSTMISIAKCAFTKKYGFFNLSLIKSGKGGGHNNAVFIDFKNRKFYRYDPHGSVGYYDSSNQQNLKKIDEALTKFCKSKLGLTYVRPIDFCPRYGPQYQENFQTKFYKETSKIGHCELYTMLFFIDIIKNPNKSPKEVANMFLKKDPNFIALRVRKLLKFANKLNKNKKSKIPKRREDYGSNRLM